MGSTTHRWAVPVIGMSFLAASAPAVSTAGTLVSGPGGHQYELVTGTDVSWDQAKADANAKGGFLATIGDAAEQSFVEKLLSDDSASSGAYLFGLHETNTKGDYRNLSGAKPSYTHWLAGQPDNFASNETSATILWDNPADSSFSRRAFWNDLPPSKGYPPVASVYPDLVPKGYLVEYAGSGSSTSFNNGDGDNRLADGNDGNGGNPNSVPLPLATSGFPAGALVAGLAARRIRRRRRV